MLFSHLNLRSISSILPFFHPKKLMMKCFFRQSSPFMLQTWSRRQCSALLCSPFLSAWKSPLWHMKHGPRERSLISKHKQTSLEAMVFLVVPCVSIFARGWDRVQVITRITAFGVPPPEKILPRSHCLFCAATLLLYPYRVKSHHLHYNAPATSLAFPLLLN